MDLNGRIEEMQEFIYDQGIEIEELRGKLNDQENEIEELRSRLRRAYDNMAEIQDLCDEKIKHNKMLVEQWNSRFSDQQKRINSVIEIAKAANATTTLTLNRAKFVDEIAVGEISIMRSP
ncbi:24356_t:CDS:2, partial [Gigaspora margarita]